MRSNVLSKFRLQLQRVRISDNSIPNETDQPRRFRTGRGIQIGKPSGDYRHRWGQNTLLCLVSINLISRAGYSEA